jgi:hypothetical protein
MNPLQQDPLRAKLARDRPGAVGRMVLDD